MSAGGTHGAADGTAAEATATATTETADGQQADADDNAGKVVNRCVYTMTKLNTVKKKRQNNDCLSSNLLKRNKTNTLYV